MKEYDSVELLTEKECYAKYGVHKGMQGWICYPKTVKGYAMVEFPLYGEAGVLATLDVRDEDLKIIPDWNAKINERIQAEYKRKK